MYIILEVSVDMLNQRFIEPYILSTKDILLYLFLFTSWTLHGWPWFDYIFKVSVMYPFSIQGNLG